jgi:hypothetical protein
VILDLAGLGAAKTLAVKAFREQTSEVCIINSMRMNMDHAESRGATGRFICGMQVVASV